jgi:hypothetical protein
LASLAAVVFHVLRFAQRGGAKPVFRVTQVVMNLLFVMGFTWFLLKAVRTFLLQALLRAR